MVASLPKKVRINEEDDIIGEIKFNGYKSIINTRLNIARSVVYKGIMNTRVGIFIQN